MKNALLHLLAAACLGLASCPAALLFGQGSAGPAPNQNISVSWAATGLTLTYSSGSVYPGRSAQAITGGTLTLTDAKNTCTVAAIQAGTDACNYIYWTTSTALSASTTFATATAAGNQALYLCGTTGGNITGCVPTFNLSHLSPVGSLSAVTGSGSAVLATSATLVTPTLTTPVKTFGVTAAAATLSPTCAAQSGQVILLGATTGEVVTLPTPAAGCEFFFIITVSNTSNSNEIQTGASQFLQGAVSEAASAGAVSAFWADGSTIRAIKMNGTTTGGLLGSYFHVVGVSTTVWEITGMNEASGVIATPFTATP